MVVVTSNVRRPRGRPQLRSDEETRALLIKAAVAEFALNGYDQTSVDAVSQRAGLSTKTLYRLIPTKAELFACAVNDRANLFTLALDEHNLEALDPAEALYRVLCAYGVITLSTEVLAASRLALAEAERFPDMAKTFYDRAIVPMNLRIAKWLALETNRGRLRVSDPNAAAAMLRGMMIFDLQRDTMLGQRALPSKKEIDARARACANLFLEGTSVRSQGN